MCEDKIVDSMINFEDERDVNRVNSDDIRNLMPKKYIDFSKAIKDLGGKLLYIKSGSTGHTFKGVYPSNPEPNYAVVIVVYPKRKLWRYV